MAVPYNEVIALAICDRLAGGETLTAICADADMPSARAVRRWAIEDHEGFAGRYQRARELQAMHYADEIITLADTPSVCVRRTRSIDAEGKETVHEVFMDQTDRTRLRIDTRKWHCSKVMPKVYGDRVDHDHTHQITLSQLIEASMKKPGDQAVVAMVAAAAVESVAVG